MLRAPRPRPELLMLELPGGATATVAAWASATVPELENPPTLQKELSLFRKKRLKRVRFTCCSSTST